MNITKILSKQRATLGLALMTALLLHGLPPALANGEIHISAMPSHSEEYSLDIHVSKDGNGVYHGQEALTVNHNHLAPTPGMVRDIVGYTATDITATDASNVKIVCNGWEQYWDAHKYPKRSNGRVEVDIEKQSDGNYHVRVTFRPTDRFPGAAPWDFTVAHDKVHISVD